MSSTSSPPTHRRLQRFHADWLRGIDRCLELSSHAAVCARSAASVSAWSVGRQLEHLLRADRKILGRLDRLLSGRPAEDETVSTDGRPTVAGRLVLWTGYIPRGRGRAPEYTVPSGIPVPDIAAGFDQVRQGLYALESRLPEVDRHRIRLAHPLLGTFSAAQWVRFAAVHHHHHGKIIRDILRAGQPVQEEISTRD